MPEPSPKPDRTIDPVFADLLSAPADRAPRFVWSRRGTPAFDVVLGLLTGQDTAWTIHASAIAIVCTPRGGVSGRGAAPAASLEPASGWLAAAVEARLLRWQAHGTAGIDWARAARVLDLPEGFGIEAALAIGRVRVNGGPSRAPATCPRSGLLH